MLERVNGELTMLCDDCGIIAICAVDKEPIEDFTMRVKDQGWAVIYKHKTGTYENYCPGCADKIENRYPVFY